MMDLENVAPEDRGKALLKWRTTLGWSVSEVAEKIGVSTRTISAVVSGAQVMPDSRWRLFAHEVRAAILRSHAPEIVVVLSTQGTPLDVVSSENYAGYALDDDGRTGLIASYSVNRVTGAPEVHRQRFPVGSNMHVIEAIERWEDARLDAGPERAALEMHRWLMRRILKGELGKPELTPLKAAVSQAKAELEQAVGASQEVRDQLLRKWDAATAALMEAVTKTSR